MSTYNKIIRAADSYGEWDAPDFGLNGEQRVHPVRKDDVRPPTVDDIHRIEEEAFNEGYKAGEQKGYTEGLAKGEARLSAQSELLAKAVTRLNSMLSVREDDLVNEILLTIAAISRQLIRRELSIQDEQIIPVIKECLALLPAVNDKVTVRISPADAEIIESRSDIMADYELLTFSRDPSLSQGGCIVETKNEKIDATLESRIAKIMARILGGQRNTDNG